MKIIIDTEKDSIEEIKSILLTLIQNQRKKEGSRHYDFFSDSSKDLPLESLPAKTREERPPFEGVMSFFNQSGEKEKTAKKTFRDEIIIY